MVSSRSNAILRLPASGNYPNLTLLLPSSSVSILSLQGCTVEAVSSTSKEITNLHKALIDFTMQHAVGPCSFVSANIQWRFHNCFKADPKQTLLLRNHQFRQLTHAPVSSAIRELIWLKNTLYRLRASSGTQVSSAP